jgi:acyl-CoA thioesterase I
MLDIGKKIGVWGDSILKGVVFDEIRGSYQLLDDSCANLVSRNLGLDILNKSRFGCTIDKGIAHLEKALENKMDCDYILLEYGGNDCDFDWPAVAAQPGLPHLPRTPLKLFNEKLQYVVDLVRRSRIEPVLMSLPPISGEGYLEFLVRKGLDRGALLRFLGDAQQIYRFQESYSLSITRLASHCQCLYAPVREAFLAHRNCPSLICADGIHPNEAGHRVMQHVFTRMALA